MDGDGWLLLDMVITGTNSLSLSYAHLILCSYCSTMMHNHSHTVIGWSWGTDTSSLYNTWPTYTKHFRELSTFWKCYSILTEICKIWFKKEQMPRQQFHHKCHILKKFILDFHLILPSYCITFFQFCNPNTGYSILSGYNNSSSKILNQGQEKEQNPFLSF